jgi:hypothetical protein
MHAQVCFWCYSLAGSLRLLHTARAEARAFIFSAAGFLLGKQQGGKAVEKARIRIFVDFWNFQLNWNDYHKRQGTTHTVPIPWKDAFPLTLVTEVSKGEPSKFAGCHVYASVDPNSPKDRKLNKYLHHVLSSFAGYSVIVKERKPRGTIRCQSEDCRKEIVICPHCQTQLRSTVEKGVDAAILTDLMTMAFDNN